MSVTPETKAPVAVLPEDWDGSGGMARCLTFYDWEREIGPQWLDLVEEIFTEFEVTPYEGTGNLGEAHSHGRYKRVRKRLRSFLEADEGQRRDFRIQGEPYLKTEAFFPSDMGVVWAIRDFGERKGAIAVRGTRVESCEALVGSVGEKLFRNIGAAYGAAFDFPTLYGPDAYLSSVGAIPRGTSSRENRNYTARLTRWRDNIWHLGLRASQGFMREVYPINFLLEAHLGMPFQGRPLSEFMEKVGDLRPSDFHAGMYRWDVPIERLDVVRQELEPSGLILSSPTPPLGVPNS